MLGLYHRLPKPQQLDRGEQLPTSTLIHCRCATHLHAKVVLLDEFSDSVIRLLLDLPFGRSRYRGRAELTRAPVPAQYEPFSNHGQPTGSVAHVHAVHWSQLCHKALLIRLLQHFRHVPDVFRQRLHGITVHFLVRLCVVLLAAHPIARARSSVTPATQRQDQWCPFGIDYAAYLEARLRQG